MQETLIRPSLVLALIAAAAGSACVTDLAPGELDDPQLGESDHPSVMIAVQPKRTLGFVANPGVDLDLMVDNVDDDLRYNVVGYALAVGQDGQLARVSSWGLARRYADGGQIYMGSNRRLNVASVGKTITAVATLQLLEANGLSIDDPIEPWLPASWTRGPGFTGPGSVTFRHLLTHTSGLGQLWKTLSDDEQDPWGNDWGGLEYVVELGTTPGSGRSYKNANFALLRIIIPALWKASPDDPGIGTLTETNHATWHLRYMHEHVFEPSGISDATCWRQSDYVGAYAYDLDDGDEAGHDGNFSLLGCGGHGGWHLSARDLAAFMAHLRHGDLLSPAMRQLMDDNRLGWSSLSDTNTSGRAGKYWHGGDLFFSSNREIHTCVMKYAQNVEAALVINSRNAGGKGVCTILKEAYNDAL